MREAEKNMWTAMNNSLFGRLCMNLLNFCQAECLHDEEKYLKTVSKSTSKNVTGSDDYTFLGIQRDT